MPEEPREGMFGKYRHTVDAKGRLFVPSKLREQLGEIFYVTVGVNHCLSVYPVEKWREIEAKLNALSMAKAPKVRLIYANLAKCEPDRQGRFLLPQELRDYARLKDEVTFIGLGDHAEVWNTPDYDAIEAAFFGADDLGAQLEELGL